MDQNAVENGYIPLVTNSYISEYIYYSPDIINKAAMVWYKSVFKNHC